MTSTRVSSHEAVKAMTMAVMNPTMVCRITPSRSPVAWRGREGEGGRGMKREGGRRMTREGGRGMEREGGRGREGEGWRGRKGGLWLMLAQTSYDVLVLISEGIMFH